MLSARVPRRGTRKPEANHLPGGGEAEAEGLSEGETWTKVQLLNRCLATGSRQEPKRATEESGNWRSEGASP
ncbi:hypothetical protein KGY79_09030 [Candidatus Bipolaricaulota bacterium]|nr:hypothetical protein [Candidatus Bipolaricaulota bacterium]